jgi:hypothetical protein
MKITDDGYARPGIGLISVGWMGKLHSRAYQAIPQVYPELKIRPRLVHAADTAPDRADYAREVLGYATAGTDYRAVLADPDVDVVSICGPVDRALVAGVLDGHCRFVPDPGDAALPGEPSPYAKFGWHSVVSPLWAGEDVVTSTIRRWQRRARHPRYPQELAWLGCS